MIKKWPLDHTINQISSRMTTLDSETRRVSSVDFTPPHRKSRDAMGRGEEGVGEDKTKRNPSARPQTPLREGKVNPCSVGGPVGAVAKLLSTSATKFVPTTLPSLAEISL